MNAKYSCWKELVGKKINVKWADDFGEWPYFCVMSAHQHESGIIYLWLKGIAHGYGASDGVPFTVETGELFKVSEIKEDGNG